MTDPTSIAPTPARLSLGESGAAFDAAVERARRGVGEAPVRPRHDALVDRSERVRRAIADRLGWLDAPGALRATGPPALEGFGDAVVEEGFTTVVVAGHGRQQPRAGRPAPDVRDAATATPACASSTRPTRRRRRRRSTTSTRSGRSSIIATKSGTTTEPNAFLADAWARVGRSPRGDRAPRLRGPGRVHRRDHRSRAGASRRSPTTTTSARSSSTRPTSAVATRR